MEVSVIGSKMSGHVPHHAGHIIGYTSGEHPRPIYCNGHNVTGTATRANQSKLFIGGKLALVDGASGPSTDPCDGSDFKIHSSNSNIYIQGKKVILKGNGVTLSPGDGKMITANQSKVYNR